MAKSNIRSMRFSDTMIEMIEAQAGDTFTAKFEALVTRCMWELPEKERQLTVIQERIDRKGRRLRELSSDVYKFRRILDNLNMQAQRLERALEENLKELEMDRSSWSMKSSGNPSGEEFASMSIIATATLPGRKDPTRTTTE